MRATRASGIKETGGESLRELTRRKECESRVGVKESLASQRKR